MAVYLDSSNAAGFSVESRKPGLEGWHRGELAVQERLGFKNDVEDNFLIARSWLTDQHRWFHTRHISFLPIGLKGEDGRVWTSIFCGHDGQPGFVSSPTDTKLHVEAVTWPGDPARRLLVDGSLKRQSPLLLAGVGVELTTRRRNKLAGHVSAISWQDDKLAVDVDIDTALGNCPKYIAMRDLEASPATGPVVALENLNMKPEDVLPQDAIAFIKAQDSLYLSTSYVALPEDADKFPSHIGCNHRGGRPGFVRVRADQRTIVLPDYSGNRFMSSLGSILTDPVAGIAFPSFKDGSVLYVTGTAETVFGDAAMAIMPRTRVLTLIHVTGYTLVHNALPFREQPSTLEASPYSPPVRYLVEEKQPPAALNSTAVLVDCKIHRGGRGDIATFTFESSTPISNTPGQYVILEAIDPEEIGYTHSTRAGFEKIVNEDGIRTWTISSAPSSKVNNRFSITVRKLGLATRHLFSLAEYFDTPQAWLNRRVELPLIGIGGDFVLPATPQRTLWIAGGIGVTPFLSFLEGLSRGLVARGDGDHKWRCELYVASREPDVLLSLLDSALSARPLASTSPTPFSLDVHIYSRASDLADASSHASDKFKLTVHEGRLTAETFKGLDTSEIGSVFLCGPNAFEETVVEGLSEAGVSVDKIIRENFDY